MLLSALTLLVLAALLQSTDHASGQTTAFLVRQPDACAFARSVDLRLSRGRQLRDRLLAVSGGRTIANTLEPYDEIQRNLDGAGNEARLIAAVHLDSAIRAAADAAAARVTTLSSAIALDRSVYRALAGMNLTGGDAATRYYAERTLLAFRLAGVDKDDATRDKIRALRDRLEQLSQAFERNIRDDVRKIDVASAAELDGMPADYIAAHRAGPDGRITIRHCLPGCAPRLYLREERRPAKTSSHRVRQSRLAGQ